MQYVYFQPEILELITDGEPEASHEIISLFLSQIDGLDSSMNLLFEQEDYSALKLVFHKFRSGCQMIGVPILYDNFTLGENYVTAHDIPQLKSTVEQVTSILPSISAELRDYLLFKPL